MIENIFIALALFASTYVPPVIILSVWSKRVGPQVMMQKGNYLHLIFSSIALFDALVLMAILSQGNYVEYGFVVSGGSVLPGAIFSVLILRGIFSLAVGLIPSRRRYRHYDRSWLLRAIVTECIFVSISEEIIFRGLIQSYLSTYISSSITFIIYQLSIPTIVGAALFAFLHLGFLKYGKTRRQVLLTVIATFVLGIFTGCFRDITGSLLTPIIMHMAFNLSGKGIEFLRQCTHSRG